MSGSRLALQGTALRMASLRGAALRGATLVLGAVLCGAWIAWSGKYGALALAVLALGATTLLVPWTWLLVALLVTVFTLVGPMQYAAGVNKAFWLPYLMGVLIGLRLLLESRRRDAGAGTAEGTPLDDGAAGLVRWGIGLGGLFLGTALLSSLLNRIGGMQALVAGKEYLFLLGLPLAFAFGHLRLEQLGGLWRWCTGWLVLQLPVVLWQRLFIAPRRGGESP